MKIIYEPTCKGLTHFMFNFSFIKVITELITDEKLVFFGDEEHIKLLKERGETKKNITFKSLKIHGLQKKILSLISGFINLVKIKFFFINSDCTELIITNSHAHTLLFAKLLFRKRKITFILHGQLEELTRKKSMLQLGYYNKFALEFMNDGNRIKYIVLGSSIKRNLIKRIPSIENNVYSMDHPYDFEKNADTNINQNKKKEIIKIGTIGNASIDKGIESLFEIDNYLVSKGIRNIELFHIGSFKDIHLPQNSNVKIPSMQGMLPREDYEKYINDLDYILFFYPKDSYKLTASGAIFDAIAYHKPVIALSNDYFSYIFDKCGEIGYLCSDLNDIKQTIISIGENASDVYDQMVNQIIKSKMVFSYEEIAKDVKGKGIW